MEISPKNTEGQQVSDVAMAQRYVAVIGGSSKVKVMLAKAYKALVDMFPHENEPKDRWTERRVRALWNGEAAVVQFREMVELHKAAEQIKAERKLFEMARKEHADFIKKTASLRALLERQDEDFHRPQIEGLSGVTGGVDRSGTEE